MLQPPPTVPCRKISRSLEAEWMQNVAALLRAFGHGPATPMLAPPQTELARESITEAVVTRGFAKPVRRRNP